MSSWHCRTDIATREIFKWHNILCKRHAFYEHIVVVVIDNDEEEEEETQDDLIILCNYPLPAFH